MLTKPFSRLLRTANRHTHTTHAPLIGLESAAMRYLLYAARDRHSAFFFVKRMDEPLPA